MRLRDVVSFSAFALIIVFVLGYFGALGIRVNPPAERTNLSMDLPETNSLVTGSNVLLRGSRLARSATPVRPSNRQPSTSGLIAATGFRSTARYGSRICRHSASHTSP